MCDLNVMAAPGSLLVDRNELKLFEKGTRPIDNEGIKRGMLRDNRHCPRSIQDNHGRMTHTEH